MLRLRSWCLEADHLLLSVFVCATFVVSAVSAFPRAGFTPSSRGGSPVGNPCFGEPDV
ncbi:hypothetical protein OH77DRAFT_1431950 [Trametes cingulata]|nr:hypothetical protein OH77DRAFT_1431950 [Trametes cingulata]